MIIIFAGHHPAAPGASYNGFAEHDEAVRWIELISAFLDATIVIKGPVGALTMKTNYVNKRKPRIAMDLHFNSAVDGDGNRVGRGSETLYYPRSKDGEHVARFVQEHLCKVCPPDRGVKEGYYRMDPKFGPDWFLARTCCPAIIVEPDFIHRKEEIQQARTAGSEAIAIGLRNALNWLEGDKS